MKNQQQVLSGKGTDNRREMMFLISLAQQLKVFFESVITQVKPIQARRKPELEEKNIEKNTIPPQTRGLQKNRPAPMAKQSIHPQQKRSNEPFLPASSLKCRSQCQQESQIPSVQEIHPHEMQNLPKTDRNQKEESDDEDYPVKVKRKRRRKGRGYHNSNSPKKPVSSFVHYYAARTKQLRKEHPEGVIGNLAKILSAEWKELSDKEKEPYVKAAELSLQTYYSEKKGEAVNGRPKEKVVSSTQSETIPKKSVYEPVLSFDKQQQKKLSDQKEEKKNSYSNFFIFFKNNCDRISQQNNESQRGKLAKLASEEWKRLSSEEKKIYTNMTKAERRRMRRLQKKIEEQGEDLKQKKLEKQRKRRNSSNEDEYRPKNYNKISRQFEEQISQKDEIELGSKKKELKAVTVSLDQKGVRRQKDRSCQMKLIEEEEASSSYFKQTGNCPLEMIHEQSERVSESRPKLSEKNNEVSFIEVNSNDEGCFPSDNNNQVSTFGKESTVNVQREKNPVNAFLIYYQETLKDLKSTHSKVLGSELVKIASSKWSELNEVDRSHYINLARQRRKSHELYLKSQQSQGESARCRLRGRRGESGYL